MKNPILLAVGSLLLMLLPLAADPIRTELKSKPNFAGHEIKRFIVPATFEIDHQKLTGSLQLRIPAGHLVPVSQDKDGGFYQAENGIYRVYLFSPIYGGIYVLRSNPLKMLAYTGDARVGSKRGIDKDWAYLSADLVRHFRPE